MEKLEAIIEVIASAIEMIDAQRIEEASQVLTALVQELATLTVAKAEAVDTRSRVDAANEDLKNNLMVAQG